MKRADLDAFGEMLDAVCSLLSRGVYQPNPMNTALFFRALAHHSLAEVRAGFDAHVADKQRGRFVPVPADILAQIEDAAADDGRPAVEEAWAKAMRSADEFETVVWTDEMAQAWGEVAPLFAKGDKVGARMAFKDVYARLVDAARRVRRPVNWSTALGFDMERRTLALAAATHAGIAYEPPDAPRLGEAMLLLEGGEEHKPVEIADAPPAARAALMAWRERMTGVRETETRDAAAKRRTEELRQRSAALVADAVIPTTIPETNAQ